MNGLLGLLAGGALALGLLTVASGDSAPASDAGPAPSTEGEPEVTERVVQGHTTAALIEIDSEIYGE